MQLDCNADGAISPSPLCERNTNVPCCHLQQVLNKIEEGTTVYILQNSTLRHPNCNLNKEIQVDVTKSFILKTGSPKADIGMKSMENVNLHGIEITFNNNCSERCSLAISASQFSCSLIRFNDVDIWIKDTQFKDSFITAGAQSGNQGKIFNMRIHNSEFMNSFPVKIGTEAQINYGPCKQLNYVCLSGNWNSIEILRSRLEGDRHSQLSGLEIMHANIQTLCLTDVKVYFMYSALVISSSGLGFFNVLGSVFMGNRDGIDIGQGVRYMLISASEMNNTGSWFGDGKVLEQCSSALRGSVQSLIAEDSVFANNSAYGINCKGAALYVSCNTNAELFMESNYDMFEKDNAIEIHRCIFYENMVANCSVGFDLGLGGGAVTVYGARLLVYIVASTFARNKACVGAGLYIGRANRPFMCYSRDGSIGQVVSSTIIIDTCTFKENIAEFGGGLATGLNDSTLNTGSNLSTLIYNSSFNRNNATMIGAGAMLEHYNVSIHKGVTVNIQISNTDFEGNFVTEISPYGYGGGISILFEFISLMSNTMVKTEVNHCSFRSNIAMNGAGMFTALGSNSLNTNSSLVLQTTGSIFTSNRAGWGAAIYIGIRSCSLEFHSSHSAIYQFRCRNSI